jgi:hypothetical protein
MLSLVLPLVVLAAAAAGSAEAGDGGGPPVYPSAVNAQMIATYAQLAKAPAYLDAGDVESATKALNSAKSHMRKAWIASKYVIDNAPPPVAGDGAVAKARILPVPAAKVKKVSKATKKKKTKKTNAPAGRAAGGAIAGASPFADQYTTALGVLTLEHDVAVTAMGMLSAANEPLITTVSSTMFAALNDRDTATAYIHSIDVPPVVVADSRRAHASGAPVAGWAPTMSGITPYIEDELQMVDELRASLKLSPGRARILNAVEVQDFKTERNLNLWWPPVVGD